MKAIYLSIKPQHVKRIVCGKKNYEFRNYVPKREFDTLFVYESFPICELKYIIELGDIVCYPDKISEDGIGNAEFNIGDKSKYAYFIKHVYLLDNPISLKELREKYSFTPPQGFAYDDRYEKLTGYMNSASFKRII